MSWIWLDNKKYSDKQYTKGSSFNDEILNYCVASFRKKFSFNKELKKIKVRFAADTSGYLLVDGKILFSDNAKTYGDFSIKKGTIDESYFLEDEINFIKPKKSFEIQSFVQLGVTRLYDFSGGHGGLFVEIDIEFLDGTHEKYETDESWISRLETSYIKPYEFDNTVIEENEVKSILVKDKKKPIDSEIKNIFEEEVFKNQFKIKGNSKEEFQIDLPHCYASHYEIEVIGNSLLKCELLSKELENSDSHLNKFQTNKSCKFRFFDLISCGGFILHAENKGDEDALIIIRVLHSYYPYKCFNKIVTNDLKLNDLFEKCSFAIKNCSQSIMLDSPKHCEPASSCAGDYNIISLGTSFLTGDYSLIKHVLREYAKTLEKTSGVNANSSYALIFIKWLKNMYMITGDKQLILDCQKAINAALNLYLSFLGKSGLVEKSYNYIFVDWLQVDGFNMFCPPKNLGQSVVTMNFYDALMCASFMFKEIGDNNLSNQYLNIAKKLKKDINNNLFDKEKGLYIEGLTTKDEEQPLKRFKPDVTSKIYYRKHANILAAAYGLQSKSNTKKLVDKIFNDPLIKDLPVQPYFDHYLFEAIHNADYDKKYAFKLINEFTNNIKITDKGLPEGFFKPDSGYVFDYSHAWACTPYYSFIVAILGLNILEPGFKKIKIKPFRTELDYSFIVPTKFGNIIVDKVNSDLRIDIPKGIEVLKSK